VSPAGDRATREAVLDAFAVESEQGPRTLERYLRLYPEYAGELVDLSFELAREVGDDDDAVLSAAEQVLIDEAWSRHAAALPTTINPFALLTSEDWRAIARDLNLPRQVATALREQRISVVSIPKAFLAALAEAMRSSVAQLEATWSPKPMVAVRSYKADAKPSAGGQVTFEQVLIEAGVPDETRARLLAEAE